MGHRSRAGQRVWAGLSDGRSTGGRRERLRPVNRMQQAAAAAASGSQAVSPLGPEQVGVALKHRHNVVAAQLLLLWAAAAAAACWGAATSGYGDHTPDHTHSAWLEARQHSPHGSQQRGPHTRAAHQSLHISPLTGSTHSFLDQTPEP